MCGICGAIGWADALTLVRRMNQAMVHRGPDSEGILDEGAMALGVRRLRIIDLSTGDQPIYNEDRTVAVVSNGEIYNFQRLSQELQASGHRFATRSDTEAIVHAYEEWDVECLTRLRGMFAFAICDRRPVTQVRGEGTTSQRFLLARDRLGIKPLYYYQRDEVFLFASEVRALLSSGLVPSRLSLDGLYSFLAFGSVQEPLTLIEGVYSLPPGHWMRWRMENGEWKQEVKRYWDFPVRAKEQNSREAEESGQLGELLQEAARLRLIAEVPLGAFLSGGIDSGAVVALMSRVAGTRVKTFTIAFEEPEFNEAPLARLTAQRFKTEHTEVRVTSTQVLAELPQALAAMDQPTMDGINTYYVSGAAKRAGLTVALSGLGGDEVFAGYSTFRTVPRLQAFQRKASALPHKVRCAFGHALSNLCSPISILHPFGQAQGRPPFSPDARHKLAALLGDDILFSHPYFLARALFTPAQVAALLMPEAQARLSRDTPWHRRVMETLARAQTYDSVNAVSYLESTHYLVSTLLRDTDQMSMAHSLEVRVPLIDHALVEFVIGLAGAPKLDERTPKHLLVKALGDALPDQVVYRQKSTFTFPWEHWLRGSLRGEIEKTLSHPPDALAKVLDSKAVGAVWTQFLRSQTSWSRPWALYVLFKWVESHLTVHSDLD